MKSATVNLAVMRLLACAGLLGFSAHLRGDTLISKQTIVGSYSSTNLSITPPSNANRLIIKAWGEGGAGGSGSLGGGSAFATVTFDLSPKTSGSQITINYSAVAEGAAGGTSTNGSYGGAGGRSNKIQTSMYLVGGLQLNNTLVAGGGGGGGGGGISGVSPLSAPVQSAYPGLIVSSALVGGSGATPGQLSDPDYPGSNVGFGGLGESGGPAGLVVLVYHITSSPAAPAITSGLSYNLVQGQTAAYNITASHSPTSYGASGLPAGLSVNTTTGSITGTATATGTTHSTISATNAVGTGQATLVWNVSADTAPPSVPVGLQSRLLTSTSFRLTWTTSTDNVAATGYEVKRDSTSLGNFTPAAADISGLTAGVTYAMTVRARDAIGNWSAWSSPLSVQQTTVNPPTSPTGLNYAERTDTTITLIWTGSTGSLPIAGYKLLRGGTEIATTTELVFADTGLPANTSQSYTVKAFDTTGNLSTASSILVVSTAPNTSTDTDHDGVPDAMETLLGTNTGVAGTNDSSNQTQLKINQPPK